MRWLFIMFCASSRRNSISEYINHNPRRPFRFYLSHRSTTSRHGIGKEVPFIRCVFRNESGMNYGKMIHPDLQRTIGCLDPFHPYYHYSGSFRCCLGRDKLILSLNPILQPPDRLRCPFHEQEIATETTKKTKKTGYRPHDSG